VYSIEQWTKGMNMDSVETKIVSETREIINDYINEIIDFADLLIIRSNMIKGSLNDLYNNLEVVDSQISRIKDINQFADYLEKIN
jgi:hypothetical protein